VQVCLRGTVNAIMQSSTMTKAPPKLTPVPLDPETVALYLRISGEQIVIFQAIFETYEGIGTVRTIDVRRSLVSVITTNSQLPDCQQLLFGIQKDIPWRCAAEEIDLTNIVIR
jgi:hypothetical protein